MSKFILDNLLGNDHLTFEQQECLIRVFFYALSVPTDSNLDQFYYPPYYRLCYKDLLNAETKKLSPDGEMRITHLLDNNSLNSQENNVPHRIKDLLYARSYKLKILSKD